METIRQIIHLDLDAFFCAVEEKLNPELRGLPFAVGGSPEGRGVVSSCSYAARVYGVHSAMPMARAIVICPDLMVVKSHFQEYREASRNVMGRLWALTDLVEQISIDEAFVDLTGYPKPVEVLARELQQGIKRDLGLPNSLGIATNKLVAKIANDYGKKRGKKGVPPNAITIVPPGTEADFLAPLPVEMLWGVGAKTAERLLKINISTIGELAAHSEIDMLRRFGKSGYDLINRARGIDDRPIVTEHETKSISQESTYAKDTRDESVLLQTLEKQSHQVARRLRKKGFTSKIVKIKLRWPDFTTLTRQLTLGQPTADEDEILEAAVKLFRGVWSPGKAVRLLGVGVSGLDSDKPKQIGLWDVDWVKEHIIQDILAEVHQKHGEDAIMRGIPPSQEK